MFKVADIYVTCAAIALVGLMLFYYSEEEAEQIPLLGGKQYKAD